MQLYELSDEDLRELNRAISDVDSKLQRWYGQGLQGAVADLGLLQRMLDEGHVERADRLLAMEIGVVFGFVLRKTMDWTWVVIEDEGRREPALLISSSEAKREADLLLPVTVILRRLEAGKPLDLADLYRACAQSATP